MKKNYLLLLCTLLTSQLFGQYFEVINSFSSYKITGTYFVDVDQNYYNEYSYTQYNRMFNSGVGYYQPVYSPTKNLTFGLNVIGQFGFMYHAFGDGDSKLMFDFSLPVTGTIKLGAGSNKYATWPVGIGIGYGYRLNSLMVDGDIFRRDEDKLFYSFIRPYTYVEISFDFQRRHKSFFDDCKIQVAIQPALKSVVYDAKFDDYKSNKMEYISFSFIKFYQL